MIVDLAIPQAAILIQGKNCIGLKGHVLGVLFVLVEQGKIR